jgi:hypothetical protein
MPFSRAENPPIAFICELKKQVRNGLVRLGEGQSAISDRADAAHGASQNHNATDRGNPAAGALRDRMARLLFYSPLFPASPATFLVGAKKQEANFRAVALN